MALNSKIDFSNLPSDDESAFLQVAKDALAIFEKNWQVECVSHESLDCDDNYIGTYYPHRDYYRDMSAFLEERRIDCIEFPLRDIRTNDKIDVNKFEFFQDDIKKAVTRLEIRTGGKGKPLLISSISISQNYKDEIIDILGLIQKIINSKVTDENKKEAITKRIANLHSEINRDRTSFDALLDNTVKLSKTIKESADNLQPLKKLVEKVKNAIFDSAEDAKELPSPLTPKLIENKVDDDEDIPF